ncbi:MAG: 2-phosphosulfolactate phosphatase [Desulfobacterales bacterium]|nr:MAG: 2-phosphosulfolactate phosphatase [Desulfobacterales bacterium]
MKITRGRLLSGAQNARGIAVIIDVFRAFTCTPLLFAMGIEKSILVPTPADAFALKHRLADLILIGEVGGIPIEGFDLGNSPSEILNTDPAFFSGRTVVQRTSAGVQGAIAALDGADEVLLGSYVVAQPTASYILAQHPQTVSLVAMGWDLKEEAPEDEWCARYLAHLLNSSEYNHLQALREITFHETTQKFLRRDASHFPAEDPILCLQRDILDFALRVAREQDLIVVRKANPQRGVVGGC